MDPITQQTVLAAAGAGGDPLYVDDVFSTFLYEGTGSAQTITNGIDISGEGGLVWIKNRESGSQNHALFDTVRGAGYVLTSNEIYAQSLSTNRLSALNSNGFTVGSDTSTNESGKGIASWTFRKQKGFFDVVTYAGNGTSGRNIAHNLGSVPGMVVIKSTSNTYDWGVWHTSLGWNKHMYLNKTNAAITSSWISTVNATDITLSAAGDVNASGETYVAYIFAHDDAQFGTGGDESIIKCGSYVGSTTNGLVTVDVGFEPQWVLIKRASDGSNHWMIFDNMRGAADNSSDQPYLSPNVSNAESSPVGGGLRAFITNNGFGWRDQGNSAQISYGGSTYIYMAIRRPNKPPEAGTDVFAIDTRGGTSPNPPTFNSGFPVDLVTRRDITTSDWTTRTRLLGENKLLQFNTLSAENTQTSSTVTFDRNDGVGSNTGVDGSNYAYMFKRAPGFMDVVTYEGTGANRTVNHNLTVKPELMLFKIRSHGFNWITYDKINGATKYMSLNGTDGGIVSSSMFNNTEPTSSVFTVAGASGNVNYSGGDLVAYLFATLPGISKVGSYTGTGNAINVDCGFTNGARFILLKLTSGAGNWYVYDSLRGIGSGDDPYFKLNSSAAQTTNSDYIDIDASGAGFKINSGSTFLNILNGNYIFLAIA